MEIIPCNRCMLCDVNKLFIFHIYDIMKKKKTRESIIPLSNANI
jgi:hypothetical protein